jgi:TetR/AcrR family transcriptional regulator, transcriptional repressor for nem operon
MNLWKGSNVTAVSKSTSKPKKPAVSRGASVPKPKAAASASTRQKLLEAAKELFHQHGISGTTIASLAQAAGVPLGNVFYHFRSKDLLLEAVLEAHKSDVRADLEIYRREANPIKRLKAMIRDSERNLQLLTDHGCPYASLAQRLRDEGNPLADRAGELLELYIEFAGEQFKELGKRNARDLAADFVVSLYGAYTLANSMGDRAFLNHQLKRLETRLEALI